MPASRKIETSRRKTAPAPPLPQIPAEQKQADVSKVEEIEVTATTGNSEKIAKEVAKKLNEGYQKEQALIKGAIPKLGAALVKSFLEVGGESPKAYEKLNDAVFDVSSDGAKSRFYILKILALEKNFISPPENVRKLDDESINNVSCYKIAADIRGVATKGKASFVYWIDKDSFLIKRIQKEIAFDGLIWTSNENYVETRFK